MSDMAERDGLGPCEVSEDTRGRVSKAEGCEVLPREA